ncbi:type IV pilus secretin PilQ family protein [Photobacterium atrarenae]|uniref:Type IV pilus secretin PilQ family protein n=2 Tax=Photobacterium atrarenae TaxID=865757 RepID=A0ABY5GIT0_9GAMM|nr:type IV pilus secretin PilQ family protein [Photobacterium atrarenae]UTV29195.1 type IV pilus secretin PilQ family protein [Photobacterium atrarenae]
MLLWLMTASATSIEVVDNKILDMDFRRDGEGRGIVSVALAKSSALVDVRQVGRQLYVDLVDAAIDDEMLYILDVADFATAVTSIETVRGEQGTRLKLLMNDDFHYDYRLNGPQLQVIVAAQPKISEAAQIRYSGKPISINFQDIPVRNVLQLIAEYNDFNLVVSDSVSGTVTLRLDDVPWPQVLDIILQAKGLDKRVKDSVVLIAPKQELDQREQQAMAAKQKALELASLRSDIVQVHYAKATDLAELLRGQEEGASMLSARGSLHVDERTNSLIINDLASQIDNIKTIVAALDIPVKQVHIEARIVSVNEDDVDEIGVRWGVLGSNGDTTVGGSIESSLGSAGLLDSDSESPVDDFLNVNLGATQPGAARVAFQVAKMGDILLDLELSALQSEKKLEIISSPRLVTTDKKMAYIEQGTEIPYLEASSSGAVSVGFKKAVLSLMVTPQITPDNKLVLDLMVTQDKKGEEVKTGNGEAVAIDTQRIGTQVLVENGETVVLGGIYQHQINNIMRKVPLLGDLPVLGALFRHKLEQFTKRELLIFVTPKIVMQ